MATVKELLDDTMNAINRIGARANEMGYTLIEADAEAAARDVAELKALLQP